VGLGEKGKERTTKVVKVIGIGIDATLMDQ